MFQSTPLSLKSLSSAYIIQDYLDYDSALNEVEIKKLITFEKKVRKVVLLILAEKNVGENHRENTTISC